MNIDELCGKLREMQVPSSWYAINKTCAGNAHCLRLDHGVWKYCYVDEHGKENAAKTFDSEQDACESMLNVLCRELRYRAQAKTPKRAGRSLTIFCTPDTATEGA